MAVETMVVLNISFHRTHKKEQSYDQLYNILGAFVTKEKNTANFLFQISGLLQFCNFFDPF